MSSLTSHPHPLYVPRCPILVFSVGEPSWLAEQTWWWVLIYNSVALYFARHRYYFAWVLSDAACNAAGLGFNGYDAKVGLNSIRHEYT